jgi:uncharacterized protein (TIGR04255 family)
VLVAKRTLKTVPLIESLFELRWGGSEGVAVRREYDLALGRLFERVGLRGFRHHVSVTNLPEAVYTMTPTIQGVVFDRFLGSKTDKKLTYPLVQFGPGIASYNVDRDNYDWQEMRKAILALYADLVQVSEGLADRVDSVTLRSLDLFPLSRPGEVGAFLKERLQINVGSALATHEELKGSVAEPRFESRWLLDGDDTSLTVLAGGGTAGETSGIILDVAASAKRELLGKLGMDGTIDRLHTLTGSAFFGLLSEDLHAELRGD